MKSFRDEIYTMFLDILSGNLAIDEETKHPLKGILMFDKENEEDKAR